MADRVRYLTRPNMGLDLTKRTKCDPRKSSIYFDQNDRRQLHSKGKPLDLFAVERMKNGRISLNGVK
jgi:hypothetical protein